MIAYQNILKQYIVVDEQVNHSIRRTKDDIIGSSESQVKDENIDNHLEVKVDQDVHMLDDNENTSEEN